MGGLIFCRPNGKPIRPEHDGGAWRERFAAARVRHAGTQLNRHTAKTLLQQHGVPEDVRMMILGHSTAAANKI